MLRRTLLPWLLSGAAPLSRRHLVPAAPGRLALELHGHRRAVRHVRGQRQRLRPRSTSSCSASQGPIVIDVPIRRYVAPVNGNGFLQNVEDLITRGVVSRNVSIRLPAFDVDESTFPVLDCDGDDIPDQLRNEVDEIYLNDEKLGVLKGNNQIWVAQSFSVPIQKLKFPSSPGGSGRQPPPRRDRRGQPRRAALERRRRLRGVGGRDRLDRRQVPGHLAGRAGARHQLVGRRVGELPRRPHRRARRVGHQHQPHRPGRARSAARRLSRHPLQQHDPEQRRPAPGR